MIQGEAPEIQIILLSNEILLTAVSEVGGTQPDTPEQQYVMTPSSGTMPDTEEQQCLKTPATDTFGDDRRSILSEKYFLETHDLYPTELGLGLGIAREVGETQNQGAN